MKNNPINTNCNLCRAVTALALTLAFCAKLNAANGTWINPAGGSWNTPGDWAGGDIADGADSTAFFNTLDLAADAAVSLDTARTIGNLLFSDTDPINTPAGWTLSGSPLTLSGTDPTITVSGLADGKSTTISAVLTGQALTKAGDGMLTLSAANTVVGANQFNAGLISYANATALGGISNTMQFNGGGIHFPVGAPALSQTNMVVSSSAWIISTNGNYDNYMATGGSIVGDASSVIYIRSFNRFTPGGTGNSLAHWTMFSGFFGTIDLTDSTAANTVRVNMGSTNVYDLSTVTLNPGTNAGRFQWRTTTAGTVVKIGALEGTGSGGRLQASEQSGNPMLTWLIGYKNLDTIYMGNIQDTAANRRGALVKVGTGRLTLGGNNTFTGNTTISNGVLALTNAGVLANTPSITIVSPGSFDVSGLTNDLGANAGWSLRASQVLAGNGSVIGAVVLTNGLLSPGSNAVATLTFDNLTLSDGASARLDVVSPDGSDKIVVNGDLSLTGASTVQVVPNPADIIFTNGTYVLFEWTGSLNGDLANVTFNYPFQLGSIVISTNQSKQIVMTVSGATLVELTWRGDLSGEWSGAANWRDTGNTAATWADGSVAMLDDSAVTKTLNLSAAVSPARVLVDGTSDYVFGTTGGGIISGSGVLVKSGTGKLTLALDNDYTGATTINSNATIQVGNGGTSGSIGSGPLINDGTFIINRADGATLVNKPISGTGSLVNNGPGQVTLVGDYTYTGETVVTNDAILQLGDGTVNGSVLGTVVLSNNATLRYFYNPNSVTVGNSLSGFGTASYEFSSAARTFVYGGSVTNTGFNGTTLVRPFSRVEAATAAANPSGPIVVEDQGAYYTHAGAFTNTQSITIVGQGPGTGVDNPRGFGALRLNNGWSGPIILSGNATIGASSGTGTILGNISDGGNSFTLEYFGGTIQVGPTAGVNSYGITHITEGLTGGAPGTSGNTIVVALNSNPFGSGAVEMVGQTTLRLNGNNVSVANLVDQSTIFAVASFQPVVQNASATLPATLTVGTDGNSALFAGVFANGGTQPLGLNKAGVGTFTVSGDSTSTGTVTVSEGTLALAAAFGNYPISGQPVLGSGSFSNAAAFAVATGATLDVSGRSDGTLTLNAGQTLKHSGASTGTINVTGNVNIGNGTLLLGINRAGFANDTLAASGSITYSGTLAVTNIGAALQAGDSFQLFPSGVTGFTGYNLQTADVVNNVQYTWNNTVTSDGKVTVQTVSPLVNPNPPQLQVSASGNTLNLAWPTNAGWTLLTNSVGLTAADQWFAYPNSANLTNVSITMDPAKTNVFFRMVYP